MTDSKKVQTINYVTNFYNKDNLLHTQKCDFKIEKARIDFATCPIIAEIFEAGIQYKFSIDSITSIDVKLSVPDNIVPKNLQNPQKSCTECKLRHRERE